MVDRDITGEIRRVGLNRLPALLGINGDSLKELAERVRQFDKAQSDETRQRKALEKIAQQLGQSILIESSSEARQRQDSRERELRALELMAVAQAYPHEELRNSSHYQTLAARVGLWPKTREQGETRNV